LCADSPLSAITIQSKCNQMFSWMDVLETQMTKEERMDSSRYSVQPKAASAPRVRGVSSSIFYGGFTTIDLRPSRRLASQLK
jgi:hypothetical protein